MKQIRIRLLDYAITQGKRGGKGIHGTFEDIYIPVPMPYTFEGMDYFLTEEEEGKKKNLLSLL